MVKFISCGVPLSCAQNLLLDDLFCVNFCTIPLVLCEVYINISKIICDQWVLLGLFENPKGAKVQWDTVSFLRFSSVINDITKRAYLLYVEYFYNHGKITTKFKGRGKHNIQNRGGFLGVKCCCCIRVKMEQKIH